jgi:hypothetical protein
LGGISEQQVAGEDKFKWWGIGIDWGRGDLGLAGWQS